MCRIQDVGASVGTVEVDAGKAQARVRIGEGVLLGDHDTARAAWEGVEQADSIVFNPHKWLGAQFDCSVQFLRDPSQQLNTLKIEPEYPHGAVYVADASRAVGVASALLSSEQKPRFLEQLRAEYAGVRERRAARNEAASLVSLAEARANALPIDWANWLSLTLSCPPGTEGRINIDDIRVACGG